ncbi:ORC2-domain-containing protein [Tothia fuscella]|uniref:Origin recognition complex subunit 2 n=1 Tax=Tothia fuscella TaxID=1048955 RepID=A0A9P4U2E4_9PEZI|nr:ORC2-domain-containing protein [Tothia fuscella]
MKRKRGGLNGQSTPSKRSRAVAVSDDEAAALETVGTPTKRRASSRVVPVPSPAPKTNGTLNGITNGNETPKSKRKIAFATASKAQQSEDEEESIPIVRNADRSARRKSSARFIERTIGDPGSDINDSDEEDILNREILGDEDQDDAGEEDGAGVVPGPSDTPKRGRGRPKGSKNRRSPTPPLATLPPHETYFWQNRPGGGNTSNNTLPSHLLLNHDEYFAFTQTYVDPHEEEKDFLLSLHQSSFLQWDFELQNSFNICLYGFGSKRELLHSFAEHIHDAHDKPPKIVVVNGYHPSTTLRDILTTIASTLFPKHAKLPLQPAVLQQLILETLTETPPILPIHLLINSIDGPSLRRPVIQSTLATLAAHPSISLVATADTPNFPLLWDLTLRQQFHFLFHNCTTYATPSPAELDVVESVNTLLGRSARRIGGRDGVGYVLKSLPENARNLYRILVAEHLAVEGDEGGEEGVEYRIAYHKAREELVCSTEHQFRGLLKEFYDHAMVESRRDGSGVERLVVPFRREDLEALLEELVE